MLNVNYLWIHSGCYRWQDIPGPGLVLALYLRTRMEQEEVTTSRLSTTQLMPGVMILLEFPNFIINTFWKAATMHSTMIFLSNASLGKGFSVSLQKEGC